VLAAGGVVFAYTKDVVRIWAPSWDIYRGATTLSSPLQTFRGWGGDQFTWASQLALVRASRRVVVVVAVVLMLEPCSSRGVCRCNRLLFLLYS
jgi:hypothetical protein